MSKIMKSRKGIAGDDVTQNDEFVEEVTDAKDESYVVQGTDSPEETSTTEEVITDDHEVVLDEDTGGEEEFLAETQDGDGAEVIEETDQSREGSRKGDKDGEDDGEDEVEEVIMNEDGDKEDLPEPNEERKGSLNYSSSAYGGKSEVHRPSILAAVDVAMRSRKL